MPEKIYIENTDEITDVIERLHVSRTKDVVFFVPQRALLLQSSINLRLLQREARKMNKEISLVTQDADGALLAEKIGLVVETVESFDEYDQQNSGDVRTIQGAKNTIAASEQSAHEMQGDEGAVSHVNAPTETGVMSHEQQNQGAVIGSDAFFQESAHQNAAVQQGQEQERTMRQSVQSVQSVQSAQTARPQLQQSSRAQSSAAGMDMRAKRTMNTTSQQPNGESQRISQSQQNQRSVNSGIPYIAQSAQITQKSRDTAQRPSQQKTHDAVSDFFSQEVSYDNNRTSQMQKKMQQPHHKISHHSFARVSKFFVIAAVVLSIFVLSFVVLPKTNVALVRERVAVSSELMIEARTDAESVDVERRVIPAEIITFDAAYTERFDATGAAERSDRKARGVITISNAYSTAAQPLVATTRFVAANGKLFRLVKGVTVPGVTTVDGEKKSGVITAEVVADESGESFNVESTTFTIPGLKGSDKFAKITAQSEQLMRGGGSQDDAAIIVSDADITRAKDAMAAQHDDVLRAKITEAVEQRGGGIFLEDTIVRGAVREQSSVAAQTAVEAFDYTVTVPIQVMVFDQEDVINIMESAVAKKSQDAKNVEGELSVEFGDAQTRYDEGVLEIDVDGSGVFIADVDTAAVHADLRGKKISDIEGVMRDKYSGIERIDLNFAPRTPAFFSRRISPVGAMLTVEVE